MTRKLHWGLWSRAGWDVNAELSCCAVVRSSGSRPGCPRAAGTGLSGDGGYGTAPLCCVCAAINRVESVNRVGEVVFGSTGT